LRLGDALDDERPGVVGRALARRRAIGRASVVQSPGTRIVAHDDEVGHFHATDEQRAKREWTETRVA
jgi:hypothetical protein